MKKRIFSLLLAAAFSISLLAGCSGESDTSDKNAADNISKTGSEEPEEKELTEVTLNEVAHSIFYAPMYVAIEEGYFEEEGIALDLVCGFGADKTMTAVISGEAEIGFMDQKLPSTLITRAQKTMWSTSPSSLSVPAISLWPVKRWMTLNGRI